MNWEIRIIADPSKVDSVGKATKTIYQDANSDPFVVLLRVHPLYHATVVKEIESDGKSDRIICQPVFNERPI